MAYTKTQWVNNTTPINDTNLNKIEQGIYDNSLIADAVTNTLNPTDTETYKTAELTEGQIIDVIGVNDIVIKGQTEQDGTPTPSAPIDINVVSESNVINTSNKNLLPNNAQSITQNGVTFTINKDKSIKINGTPSSHTDIYLYGGISDTGEYLYFPKGTYSLSTPDSKFIYIAREKTKGALVGNQPILEALASDDCYFYGFFVRAKQNSVFNNFVIKPQLEKGSTATAYTPHQGKELPLDLGSIELCKIGNYQDYFYKSGSKWYLHKEIGKITFNGTESWSVANTGTSNFYYQVAGLTTPKSQDIMPISDYFIGVAITNSNTDVGAWIISSGTIRLRTITEDTLANFKTWLSTNTPLLYYVLATVTDTEITDTTLISQLETIYNAPLYEQTNITQENNDLPMVLDITACKDNINGIKAFIRK